MALGGKVEFIFEGKDQVTPEANKAAQGIQNASAKAQKSNQQLANSFNEVLSTTKTFSREFSQLSRTLTLASGAVSAAFIGAFQKARQEVPAVDRELKNVQNSFQDMANSVATATLPTLREFAKLMNGLAAGVRVVSAEHGELLNQILKFSGAVVVFSTLALVLGQVLKAFLNLIGILRILGSVIVPVLAVLGGGSAGIGAAIIAAIGAAIAVIVVLIKWVKSLQLESTWLGKIWEWLAKTFQWLWSLVQPAFNWIQQKAGTVGKSLQVGVLDKMSGLNKLVDEAKKASSSFWEEFHKNTDKAGEKVEKLTNVLERFTRGFQSNLKSLGQNLEDFGTQLSSILETHLGDTFFNALTGRLKTTKGLLKAFGEDVLRAFTRGAANQFIGSIFGTSDKPSGGLFGGLFSGLSIFGRGAGARGGKGKEDRSDDNMKEFNKQVISTTENFKKFQVQKDITAQKLFDFGSLLRQVGQMISQATNQLVKGFLRAMSTILSGAQQFVSALLSLLSGIGGGGKKQSLLGSLGSLALGTLATSFLGPIGGALGGIVSGAIFGGGGGSAGGVAPGAGSTGTTPPEIKIDVPKMAKGGIVTRPTLALIGEKGPEAVTPLSGSGGIASPAVNVSIKIDKAMLNEPSNIDSFVNKLNEQLGYLVQKGLARSKSASA